MSTPSWPRRCLPCAGGVRLAGRHPGLQVNCAEQDLNVWLAERQGAARLVAQRHAGTPALTRVAREMLADQSYRENATRIQQIFASVDGPGAAADAIIALAGERGTSKGS